MQCVVVHGTFFSWLSSVYLAVKVEIFRLLCIKKQKINTAIVHLGLTYTIPDSV